MAILSLVSQEQIIAILAIDHNVLTPPEAIDLLERCRAEGTEPLEQFISDSRKAGDGLLKAIGAELGYPYFDMANTGAALKVDASLIEDVDLDALERYTAIPMSASESGVVVVVTGDPTNPLAKRFLEKEYQTNKGMQIKYAIANPFHIRRELATLRTKIASEEISLAAAEAEIGFSTPESIFSTADDMAESSPVIKFVANLLETAVHRRASDIHINPYGDGTYRTLYRIDGSLQLAAAPPRLRETEVVAQIMYRADMDPSNMRFPQDGRLKFEALGRVIDGRVNMVPQVGGAKVTVRLLDPHNLDLGLEDMGLSGPALKILRRHSHRSQGAMLVSGPTGSGKTTTLYALLREIQTISKNIMTVEDPVEYLIPGINQVQVAKSERTGVTFPTALRAMMRSDPDIILVGEIRDGETAEIAAAASITGHLVLSTIHAPSALEVFPRFTEMGVPTYIAAEAISVTTAQRLMRRVCSCGEPSEPSEKELFTLRTIFGDSDKAMPGVVTQPRGCAICNGVGYHGRIAVAEVLEISEPIKRLLASNAPLHEVRDAAYAEDFIDIAHDAFRHVAAQRTTVEEYARVVDLSDLMD